ncbi:MAG: hypothetical protein AB7S61_04115 [Methanoregulaceae archaeon]
MERRYAFLAAVALVALVLIPSAALAAGFQHGFGAKASPMGHKNLSSGAPAWAGNATAPQWNATGCAGSGTCLSNQTCDRAQNRTQLRDGSCLDQANPPADGKRFARQGQGQRGRCR